MNVFIAYQIAPVNALQIPIHLLSDDAENRTHANTNPINPELSFSRTKTENCEEEKPNWRKRRKRFVR